MPRPRTVSTDRPAERISVLVPPHVAEQMRTEAKTRGLPLSMIARNRIIDGYREPLTEFVVDAVQTSGSTSNGF